MNSSQEREELLRERLSVFVDSFSIEAADAVFGQDEVEQDELASTLNQLVSEQALTHETRHGYDRYRYTQEQYRMGCKQLSDSGKEGEVYSRLVAYYLNFGEQSLAEAFGPDRAMWIGRLEDEHVNLQTVFKWLIKQGDAERGLRLAYLLQELWFEDRHTGEARILFDTLLALPTATAHTRSRAQYLDLAGAFALNQNDYDEARSLKQEGLAICRELNDRAVLGSSLVHLGHVERYAGEYSAAQLLYQEALEIFQELDDPVWIAFSTANLASAVLGLGNYSHADKLVQESLEQCRELDFEWELALTLGNAAGVAAGLGQPERSIRLAGASTAHRERIGVSLPPLFKDRFEQMIISARQTVSESVQTEIWAEGTAMTLEEAVTYALTDQV